MLAVRPRSRRVLADVGAIAFLAAVAVVFLAPSLVHGGSIGPYDVLHELGLTSQPNPSIHNAIGSDEIEEFIPWQALDWILVRSGHLPLWNQHSLLGMPLAFNLESAPFEPTVAFGYLFPLLVSHTATVAARLLVAGSGAYVFGRMLRMSPLAALVAATTFELSGGFTIWLGAYEAGAYCYSGWVFAASLAVFRGRRRSLAVVALAVSLACVFSGGDPQIALIFGLGVAVFVLVTLAARRRSGDGNATRRVVVDHLLGILAACGLIAPLYLPAIQLGLASARSLGPPISGLPPADLTHLVFSDFNGVPTSLASIIGPDNLYVTMVYVGAIGAVLAVVGAFALRRRPEALGLTVLAALVGIALFFPPLISLLRHIPVVKVLRLDLATPMLDFAVAMLAGLGAHALVSSGEAAKADRVDRVLAVATAASALVLVVLGIATALGSEHLGAAQLSVRTGSFLWPTLSTIACAVVLAGRRLAAPGRAGRGAGVAASAARALAGRSGIAVLLAVETATLLIGGATFLSSSASGLRATPAVSALKQIVGTSLVGIGSCGENVFPNAGVLPNVNVAFGIDELTAYDPIIPTDYYTSYGTVAGTSRRALLPHIFCPAMSTVHIARVYGVSYVLEPPGVAGAPGMALVTTIHGEGLYKVPLSGRASLTPLGKAGPRVVEPAVQSSSRSWTIDVDAKQTSLLRMAITDVPGWNASIDGRRLALAPHAKVELQAVVPPGRHVIRLEYWPTLFSVGLLIAAATLVALIAALLVALVPLGSRRRPAQTVPRAPLPPARQPVGG